MSKLLLSMIAGAVFAAGAASAQTATPSRSNEQNPEATCPAGMNCAPGQASPSTASPSQSRPAASDVTGARRARAAKKTQNIPVPREQPVDEFRS